MKIICPKCNHTFVYKSPAMIKREQTFKERYGDDYMKELNRRSLAKKLENKKTTT